MTKGQYKRAYRVFLSMIQSDGLHAIVSIVCFQVFLRAATRRCSVRSHVLQIQAGTLLLGRAVRVQVSARRPHDHGVPLQGGREKEEEGKT